MKLEPQQESLLRGESGATLARAMETLVRYGDALGAERLVPIRSSHLAGTFGIVSFRAYLDVLDRITAEGLRVKVPTTVNPRPGRERNIPNRIAFAKQSRLEGWLEAIGVTPNYSCVCYEGENVPGLGDRLAWAESSAVQYANSVLGARTNRNSILIDVCSALTGLTPEFGYLLDKHRRGRILVRLDVKEMDANALGFVVGREAVDRVPVIEHYPFSRVELKNMGGAMAASGAVALFHVEGVTPEAPDLKSVFDGKPERTITVTQGDLDALRTQRPEEAGLVVFGCPQLGGDEAVALAGRFDGGQVRRPTWFCMVPEAMVRFERTDHFARVRRAGVYVNSYCPLAALSVHLGRGPILTPSGKLYYYLEGTEYGTRGDCLRACGVGS